jgi:hypothetical protein
VTAPERVCGRHVCADMFFVVDISSKLDRTIFNGSSRSGRLRLGGCMLMALLQIPNGSVFGLQGNVFTVPSEIDFRPDELKMRERWRELSLAE